MNSATTSPEFDSTAEDQILEMEADLCHHEWVYTGTAYGGDDESFRGEGRCYCCRCGEDGDA